MILTTSYRKTFPLCIRVKFPGSKATCNKHWYWNCICIVVNKLHKENWPFSSIQLHRFRGMMQLFDIQIPESVQVEGRWNGGKCGNEEEHINSKLEIAFPNHIALSVRIYQISNRIFWQICRYMYIYEVIIISCNLIEWFVKGLFWVSYLYHRSLTISQIFHRIYLFVGIVRKS